ncbi:MAG: hypothetical protein IKH88_14245 [Prevotella sp.]|nr:hypothetical protein [Prevotella sp.]
MMKRLLNPVTLWLATLIVVAAALITYESDLLWKVQQHNVFLDTSEFLHQMMAVPGGMLSYLAAYFSQHFYHPWVGVILMCCWWLLLMWLTKRTFNIPNKWAVLTLIPVAILLVANMVLGYWVYFIKLPGYFYVPTIGTTVATALLWAFRCLPQNMWVRAAFILMVTLVGYPLMGAYALAAVALMAVLDWRLSNQTSLISRIVTSAVASLGIFFVPLLYYHFVFSGTNITDIWRAAIPVFTVAQDYPNYYVPYYALAVCFLMMAAACRRVRVEQKTMDLKSTKDTRKSKKSKNSVRLPVVSYIWSCSTFVIIVGAVYWFWYKDANFHHELRMQRCVEQADWEGVIEEGARQEGEPTRAIVMMHNLALGRLGRQCDEMYAFPKGSKKSNTPLPVFMFHVAGRMMLYQYGAMNECHRMCMEEGVEYGWNVEQLKGMARCAILNKEKQAARKFLDILRHTSYYGGWADHMEKLLNDPKQLANDKETGPITHMMHYTDGLNAVEGYVERFLMTSLAQQDADDLFFQEQAVIGAMWTRDPNLFWPRFDHYVQLNGEDKMPPRIFQEAAWLFANMQGQEGLDEWVLQPGVKENLAAFMQLMQQFKQTPNASIKNQLFDRFGKTYYFEFFFLKDITYY